MIAPQSMTQHICTLHRLSFYCFVFLLPWQTIWIIREVFYGSEKWQYGTIGIYGADIFLVIWICLSIYLYYDRITNFFSKNIWLITASVFVVTWGFLSILWADDRPTALYGALILSFACDLFLLVQIIPLHVRATITIFVISTCAHACIGLWQFVTQSSFDNAFLGISSRMVTWGGTATLSIDGERWLRAYGALPHPNVLGALLLTALILALYLSFTARNNEHRFFTLVCIGIISAGIIVTFSRTVWCAAGVTLSSLAIITLLRDTDRKQILAPFILIIGIVSMMSILFFPLLSARTTQDTRPSHNSISDRSVYFQHSYTTFTTHPLIGTSLRNYTNTVFLLYEKNLPIWYIQPVHNIYVLAVAEYGLIGTLFLLFFFFHIIVTYLHTHSNNHDEFHLFLLLVIIAILTIGMFDHWPWSSHLGVLLTLFFIGLLLRKKVQQELDVERPHTISQ